MTFPINPVIPYRAPLGYPAYSQVTPFTIRSGATYQDVLESIRAWIRDAEPQINQNFESLDDLWNLVHTFKAISSGQPSYSLHSDLIDETGATDSTVGVQLFLDAVPAGAIVIVPSGAVIKLTKSLLITKSITLTGGGELRWTAGIDHDPAINVQADNCNFVNLHMTNPNRIAASTGNRAYGIYFAANYGNVEGCLIDGFQNAVWVDANGEWHHHTVIGNRVINVPGSGTEDRGDGIYMAGAIFTVVGNVVSAWEDGIDGRIGIGAESLQAFVNPGTHYPYQDRGGVIANNMVLGKFRRSIANEGVENVSITGNSCIGFKWWGINVAGTAHYCVCTGNTIRFESTTVFDTGSTYTGILIYDNPKDCRVEGNSIIFLATPGNGSRCSGIEVTGSAAQAVDLVLANNTIDGNANQIGYGIWVRNGANRMSALFNSIRGFSVAGISMSNMIDPTINDNRILGSTGTKGITCNGDGSDGRVDGNTIAGLDSAIEFFFRSGAVSVSRNLIRNCGSGINLYGWKPAITLMLAMNHFASVQTKMTEIPTSGVTNVGNTI